MGWFCNPVFTQRVDHSIVYSLNVQIVSLGCLWSIMPENLSRPLVPKPHASIRVRKKVSAVFLWKPFEKKMADFYRCAVGPQLYRIFTRNSRQVGVKLTLFVRALIFVIIFGCGILNETYTCLAKLMLMSRLSFVFGV